MQKLYLIYGLNWDVTFSSLGEPLHAVALCPKRKCNCRLASTSENFVMGEWKFKCVKCGNIPVLTKSLENTRDDVLRVVDSYRYSDAEVINIDGERIPVQRQVVRDGDYWVRTSIARNNKDEVQLMVLAGSKKDKNKTQLFLHPENERFAFDQNDSHPREVFASIIATFKNSKVEMATKDY